MAISNATRLSDFGSGIGTAGAVLKVDNTNQRVGIGTTDPRGMLQVGTAITMNGNTGIATFTTVYATTIGDSNTTFAGDGSALTGVSGFSTALASSGPGQQLFKTNETLTIGAGTSYKVESDDASGNVAFSRCANIHLGTGATFVVGTGTTLFMDVLGVFN
tara:strand:- start:45 stop:527 length:483 start_codon:yes stop_codon:yes gene_type:complete